MTPDKEPALHGRDDVASGRFDVSSTAVHGRRPNPGTTAENATGGGKVRDAGTIQKQNP